MSDLPAQDGETADVRQDVRVRGKPYKENFDETRFRLFFEGDGANTYQVGDARTGFAISRVAVHSDQGSSFESETQTLTSRLHTPRQELS